MYGLFIQTAKYTVQVNVKSYEKSDGSQFLECHLSGKILCINREGNNSKHNICNHGNC